MSNPEEGNQTEAGQTTQEAEQQRQQEDENQTAMHQAADGEGAGEAGTESQPAQQDESEQEGGDHPPTDSVDKRSANGHDQTNSGGRSEDEEPEQKRKLFLGGLDYGTREEALREYFATFGTLKDVVVMRFPDTKRSRGFGFVTFASSQEANQCFQAKPHTIDGVVIETKRATPREEASGPGAGRRGRRHEDEDDEGMDGDQRPPGKEPECQRKLFIGGLDYGTSDEGLKDYFSQFGQIVDSVVMKFRDTKRSRGFGFVTYATAAMVDECQAQRPHTLDGTKIEVKRATPREEVDRGDDGQTVNKVFVGGLSDAITDDVLREYFGQFGHVISAEHRVVKSTGKKRGFGFVEFDDYDPVDKLLLKSRHMLKGRRLDVKRAVSKSEMHMRDEPPRGERDDYRYPRDRPPAPWAGQRHHGYESRGGYSRGGGDRDSFAPGPFGPREVSSPWDRPARAQPSPWQSAGGGSAGGGGGGGNSWESQAVGWGQPAATPWMDDGYGAPREARGGGSSYGGGGSAYGGGGSTYGGGSSYGAGSSYGGGSYGDSMAGGASRDAGGPMRNSFGSYYNRNAAPYDRNGRGGSRPAAPVEGGGYGYMSGGSGGGAGGGGARCSERLRTMALEEETSQLYLEHQRLQLCAVHVLNNLFQDSRAFSQAQLNQICLSLNPSHFFNPHKSWIGLGNYDVNVIMAALSQRNMNVQWFDKRRPIEELPVNGVFGYIMNIPSAFKLFGWINWPGNQRHWVAIKYFESFNEYVLLDSNAKEPQRLGEVSGLRAHIGQAMIGDPSTEVLVVFSTEELQT
ncbi:hypothetical protein TCAL_06836 [Tigriopus californicus]|uniref:ubiquitinyl hydrolase 1 n=2 Tax=Tigriopus californicus TaxID=6832 RepID=A0A553NTZ1_TIGCA|nr:hypothetical protein TCAL_06836 [Tigriopus californicus]